MTKHYSTDNECLLTGGLWALIAALIISGISLFFVNLWPAAVLIFVLFFLAFFAVAYFMCKTRTVGRGVDVRAIDIARAEMGMAPHTDLVEEPAPAVEAEPELAAPAPEPEPAPEVAPESPTDEADDKPELLTEARGGQADDLKKIKGVGPKLEKELNAAGVFHFDQIASWSPEQIAWADQHLVSFKGRVSRDDWVTQAKELTKD